MRDSFELNKRAEMNVSLSYSSEYLTTKAGEIFQSLTFDEFFGLVSSLQASEDNFQKKDFGLI